MLFLYVYLRWVRRHVGEPVAWHVGLFVDIAGLTPRLCAQHVVLFVAWFRPFRIVGRYTERLRSLAR